jgi:hypothetical protein
MTTDSRKSVKTTLQEKISRLPELPVEPLELAGKLGYSDKVPIVTIRPHKLPDPVKPPSITPHPKKAETSLYKYYTQVTYPRVICQPPPYEEFNVATLFNQEGNEGSSQPESDIETIGKKERFYKLTTLNGVKLQIPFWCSVKYGPWLAIATQQESCNVGEPDFWQLYIIEMPEVLLSWYGTWEDMPPYPSLHVFMNDKTMFGSQRMCCPGYQMCFPSMSCIPFEVNCPDPNI